MSECVSVWRALFVDICFQENLAQQDFFSIARTMGDQAYPVVNLSASNN